ncbi:unnamed protein product [Rhizoctonia solani]|uniref:CRAL-TRIO domain-containing protein n=1 Tax=Rhizoctonia solani TaxID=456999 RepID=A0A8H2XNN9_9AGAM|nr:unnamed protein product [Rhizoctonia solani]
MSANPEDPLAGYVGHLTPEQEQVLSQLKSELQNEGWFFPKRHDDPNLLRFLRDRKFDLAGSKKMILACEEWRKEFGVDNIVNNSNLSEKSELRKYYPQYFHKTDKDGRPLYIERFAIGDAKALGGMTEEKQLHNFVNELERLLYERLPACSAAAGRPVENMCAILDLKGGNPLDFFKVTGYVFKVCEIAQKYYVGCLDRLYVINSPSHSNRVAVKALELVKTRVDDVAFARFIILDSNYKKTLLEQIPIDNLPTDFGGACSCPGGCAFSDPGPWNDDDKYKDLAKSTTR